MSSEYTPLAMPGSLMETGTPPNEWSEPILASRPAKDTPGEQKGESGASEEKLREPLQAPRELEKQGTQPSGEPEPATGTTGYQPSVGESVVQTAKQYMPDQVGRAVDYAAQTAAAAAAAYLPDPEGIRDTVSSYLSSVEPVRGEEQQVSLPSTELTGAQPSEHVGGVGALPGNLSESSVALLPEERKEKAEGRRPATPRQRRDTAKPSTASGEEPREFEKEAEETKSGDTPASQDPVVSQPSDSPGSPPGSIEVGTVEGETAASPGPKVELQKEVSETESRQVPSEQETTGVVPVSGMVGTAPVAEQLGEREEEAQGPDPASEDPPQDNGLSSEPQVQEGKKEGETKPARKVEPGYGGDYHPAQLHPPPPGASVAEYKATQSATQEGQETQDVPETQNEKQASVCTEKKPGFMTMVKGEMKILAGKMRGDEHKVEEGKKIVHGET